MSLPQSPPSAKKHKRHKSEKKEKIDPDKPGLKLILKVGSQTTPEHVTDYSYSGSYSIEGQDAPVTDPTDPYFGALRSHHKKSKKKKKKKDKNKDRERKHKHHHHHHHKDKKRKREDTEEENTQDSQSTPVLGSPSQHREPRTCVLRKIQERSPLQKMLDQLLGLLEKKDPQNFFAWPVTDNIAPGYSSIITQPMDFFTVKQKIEEGQYTALPDFVEDFKLICNNAMKYNHQDTIYYKAAKKLLHTGLRILQPEKLGWVITLIPELTNEDMGFEITPELRQHRSGQYEDDEGHEGPPKKRMPPSKFEAVPDDMTPEEVLARSQAAAREARARIIRKRVDMGFLRTRRDGSTSMTVVVPGDGCVPGTRKRPVLLGQLVGRLQDGTAQLQGFREDRRNIAKPVRPVYYGAFGSYAPSYDSAFSNLSKEESELVYQTYGSDGAVQYAESVQDFVKESDYATQLVDSLLDLLTGGDHSKTKKTLDENKKLREEEEAVKTVLEVKPIDSVKIDIEELRSLQDVGIDTAFLDSMSDEIRLSEERFEMQQRLTEVSKLLDKLQNTQYKRLSQPLPPSLHQVPQPSEEEIQLAESIQDTLAEIAKKVTPGQVAPVAGVRKAMGMTLPPQEAPQAAGGPGAVAGPGAGATEVVPDLEMELRQLLESETADLRDDQTIEEILIL